MVALFLVAVLGGAQNAIAGGGSFYTFPTMLFAGIGSIVANATSTIALWPGSIAGAFGYREELKHERRILVILGFASLTGGLVGALLLLKTPERTFDKLIPFLLGGATLIFAFGPSIARRLRQKHAAPSLARLVTFTFVQFLVAIYGGYFGGGIGILMLASFAAMGMEDLHAMNGLKGILASIINGIAVVTFILAGIIDWPVAFVMIGGSVIGGYGMARVSKRIDAYRLRQAIIAIGVVLTVVFLYRAFA